MILNRKSPDVFADVAKFTALAQPDMLVPCGAPTELKAAKLAISLIDEECNKEYIPAIRKYIENPTRENLIGVADGAMDCIYVIAWACRVLNIPAQAMWNEVQRSNMAKFPIADGEFKLLDLPEYAKIVVDLIEVSIPGELNRWVARNLDTGKVLKPQYWTPPNLHKVLEEHETIRRMRTMPDGIATAFLKDYFHKTEERWEQGEIEL